VGVSAVALLAWRFSLSLYLSPRTLMTVAAVRQPVCLALEAESRRHGAAL